jgi:hypothetical protein
VRALSSLPHLNEGLLSGKYVGDQKLNMSAIEEIPILIRTKKRTPYVETFWGDYAISLMAAAALLSLGSNATAQKTVTFIYDALLPGRDLNQWRREQWHDIILFL